MSSFCPTELRNLRLNKGSTLPEVQGWCQGEGVGSGVDSSFLLQSFSFWPEFAPAALGATSLHGGGQPLSENGGWSDFLCSCWFENLWDWRIWSHFFVRHQKGVIFTESQSFKSLLSSDYGADFPRAITLLYGNHTEPISTYPRRALF